MLNDQHTDQIPPEPQYDLLLTLLLCAALMQREQQPIVDSLPLDDQQEPPDVPDQPSSLQDIAFEEEHITQPQERRSQRRFPFSFVVMFLLASVLVYQNIPFFSSLLMHVISPPQAKITLFSAPQTLHTSYTVLAVTGSVDSSHNQIPSRIVSSTTPTIATMIKTTGIGYTPPTQAIGTVTFYNAAIYIQTIAAGTVLTGTDGIQIVTDQPAFIGAGNPPLFGMATVATHTLQAGSVSNIAPLAIDGLCCVAGISVKNTGYFTGGLDPKSYPMLSQADIDQAVSILSTHLDTEGRDSVQSQILPDEKQFTPISCRTETTTSPAVGARAISATITVSQTCTSQVYDSTALQTLVQAHLTQEARQKFGEHFTPQGAISISIAKQIVLDSRQHTYFLSVLASGTWNLTLSETQRSLLAKQIAGKSISQARTILLHLSGMQGVYIQPADNSSSLPTDPSQIQISVS